MSKFLALLVAVALGVVAVAARPAAADRGPGGGQQQGTVKIEGTVSAVNAAGSTVTITTRSGPVVVTVGPATKVERNDRPATLAAFKVGDRGQAIIPTAGGPAVKVEATGP
ncbi:MAG: hypothetical protein K2X87_16525 [Gemmataceae bacterium]|nr:hypothetical protein [Gemmataceae bacterium]